MPLPATSESTPCEAWAAPDGAITALPRAWDRLWGSPEQDPARIEWRQLKKASRDLAAGLELRQTEQTFGAAVGSEDLRGAPVHRWFTYKEGFSPSLLGLVLEALELSDRVHVADPFGGVATSALAGLTNPAVAEVRSVEYSPFARFAGQTKLLWPSLDPERLEGLLPAALAYDHRRQVSVPGLAGFSNPEIFSAPRLRALLSARDHLRELDRADQPERDFFLLGLAAVLEDLSGAMKDGRALRIKRDRSRRASSLAGTKPLVKVGGSVKRTLAGQWSAMIADLHTLSPQRSSAHTVLTHHLPGDARHLDRVRMYEGDPAFPDGWAGVSLFSPPYLNCIDYTELYKIELWFLGYISNQGNFRDTRLGTLRSHPSVRFSDRDYFAGLTAPVIELVRGLSKWISENGSRPEVGPIVSQYFEDMLQVWREQLRILCSGASAVCVVANSTFSRREKQSDGTRRELWRLPVLTDVILAHLALLAGFDSVQIWQARELRPRNVRAGQARESLVVARKR